LRRVGPYFPLGQPSGTTAQGAIVNGSPSARRARKRLHNGSVIRAGRAVARLVGASFLCALSASVVWGASVRCPPHGSALFTVELPDGWRSRLGQEENEVRAESAGRDADLSIRVIEDQSRSLDDAVARLVDSSYTKVEFSNLHQNRIINGKRFAVFRGFGRDRIRGTKTPFEIFAFPAGAKTGMLFFRYRAASQPTIDAAHAIVESVEPSTN
jgi:hypothetical protein